MIKHLKKDIRDAKEGEREDKKLIDKVKPKVKK